MESWVEPNLEIILKEIIENLGQLEQNILPTLDILVRVVAAHVGKNCHMHGLIRDAVLKIYYISKVSRTLLPSMWNVGLTNDFIGRR